MRGILFGGPCEGKVLDDVPAETETIDLAGPALKFARYARHGDETDEAGPYFRFDFAFIYERADSPGGRRAHTNGSHRSG
jgi:hypothetical protein